MLASSNDPVCNHVDSPTAWYAIYTRHQHEKNVASILTHKGFEILLPLYPAARLWTDRTKVLSIPLFPCYVFLNGGLDRRLDIMTTPGIFALVSCAGQPTAIPPAEIEAIRQVLKSGARVEPHPFLKCGESVRVKTGPLAGIEGILVRKKNLCRLILSVEMLGKAVAVEVDSFQVERTNGRRAYPIGIGYETNVRWAEPSSTALT